MLAWRSCTKHVLGALALAAVAGCVVEHDRYYGPSDIEFDEVRNLGATCAGGVTSWTVVNRDTGDQGTAPCETPITFRNVAPNTTYTFDITGYAGPRLCWQGACGVTSLHGEIAYADCSAQIAHLCGP
jgi:hypothetical protein